MIVAVWDTYVTKPNGTIMHFDIIAPDKIKDSSTIYAYGNAYLKSKGLTAVSITSKECTFCHIEKIQPQWEEAIIQQGYFIFEMENCN